MRNVLPVLIGKKGADELEILSESLLEQAAAQARNPIGGDAVHIRPEDRLRLAVAEILVASGLLRQVIRGVYHITDLGYTALDRLDYCRRAENDTPQGM